MHALCGSYEFSPHLQCLTAIHSREHYIILFLLWWGDCRPEKLDDQYWGLASQYLCFFLYAVSSGLVYLRVSGFKKEITYTVDSCSMDSDHAFESVIMSYGCVCTVEVNNRTKEMRMASSRGFGHYNCSHHSSDVVA